MSSVRVYRTRPRFDWFSAVAMALGVAPGLAALVWATAVIRAIGATQ